ncbi:general stress protein [Bacillus cihuensis]|uniref:general stress protein n=1 Tax=Bacillus cihuensis TaxID=1208599 RepID=UPI0004133265|nr:general stress protein [Bacillus cihuensis]
MDNRVIGVYETEEQAVQAIKTLKEKGYSDNEISIVAKHIDKIKDHGEEIVPKASRGMIAGATTGGAIGLTGLFIGLSALAIPGFGPILAIGPIFTTLAGAVAGAASGAGGLLPALNAHGISEKEAKMYQNDLEIGRVLVMVHKEKKRN